MRKASNAGISATSMKQAPGLELESITLSLDAFINESWTQVYADAKPRTFNAGGRNRTPGKTEAKQTVDTGGQNSVCE